MRLVQEPEEAVEGRPRLEGEEGEEVVEEAFDVAIIDDVVSCVHSWLLLSMAGRSTLPRRLCYAGRDSSKLRRC